MSVLEQTDSTVEIGVLLLAGLVAGGLAALVFDEIPRYVLPAVGLVVMAAATYWRRRD
ncbi:MAG: hypothetical protein ABEI99_12350 [Halobaculum sp.]